VFCCFVYFSGIDDIVIYVYTLFNIISVQSYITWMFVCVFLHFVSVLTGRQYIQDLT